MKIKIWYSAVDGYQESRTFKTLKGAQKYARYWVGAYPELGSTYAISGDGVAKIEIDGASLTELFPEKD